MEDLGDWICQFCNSNEIEDEFHFIMRCKFYKDKREIFLAKLFDIYDTENLSDQFKYFKCI